MQQINSRLAKYIAPPSPADTEMLPGSTTSTIQQKGENDLVDIWVVSNTYFLEHFIPNDCIS